MVNQLNKQQLILMQENERYRAIVEMVAGVAHEINTPLGIVNHAANIISGHLKAELIDSLNISAETKEDLEDTLEASQLIQANIIRINEMIQQFKSVSVEQLGEPFENIDIVQKLNDFIRLFIIGSKAKHLDITLNHQLSVEQRQWIGYPGALFQIVQNLLSNIDRYAYDKISPAKVELVIQLENGHYKLQVRDFGKGIAKTDIANIFTILYTTGRDKGGSGLGLAIVKNLVIVKLQGCINVTSELGKGTTITLLFPQQIAQE